MTYLITILSLLLFGYWFVKLDFTYSFGPIMISSVGKKNTLYILVISIILVSLLSVLFYYSKDIIFVNFNSLFYQVVSSIYPNSKPISNSNLLIISVVSFITLWALSRLSKFVSAPYTFLAAIIGWKLATGLNVTLSTMTKIGAVWLIAPIEALSVSMILYFIITTIYHKRHPQLFSYTYVLHLIAIGGSILFAVAIGINNEYIISFISNNLYVSSSELSYPLLLILPLLVLVIIIRKKFFSDSDKVYMKYYDLSITELTTVILSCTITLFIFSSSLIPDIDSHILPISLSSIFLGSVVGIGLMQGKEKINSQVLIKSLIANIISPLFALILSYYITDVYNMRFNIDLLPNNLPVFYKIDLNIVLISILAVIVIIFGLYVKKQHHIKNINGINSYTNHQELFENQKLISQNEVQSVIDKNQKLQGQLEYRRQSLIDVALKISEQKTFLTQIYNSLNDISLESDNAVKKTQIRELKTQIEQRLSFSEEIDGFYSQLETLHKDFEMRIIDNFPKLTKQEKKLTILLRLGFSSKYIASLMNISPKSVEISRYRLRIKLGLKKGDNLIKFIKNI
ncbi:MAG: LuxR C-terminal-related transcriptional regulator [Bacteroidales bacterium]